MPRHVTFAIALVVISCAGCSRKKQDYRVVPFGHADALLEGNAVVVEGVVTESSSRLRTPLSQHIFFWIPMGVSTENPEYNATVVLDAVLRGDPGVRTIRLRDYREMRRQEHAMFVDGLGLHINSRVRLGYDRRRGERLEGLEIAPLGNTPEFDAAMRETRRRLATRPVPPPATSRPAE